MHKDGERVWDLWPFGPQISDQTTSVSVFAMITVGVDLYLSHHKGLLGIGPPLPCISVSQHPATLLCPQYSVLIVKQAFLQDFE